MDKMVKTRLQTPNEIRHQIWKELGRSTQDRHHAWRTPVLATACADGSVNARTVVLRAVDKSEAQLQIFTDARSPKIAEITDTPNAVFVFWSSRLSWQLRLRVRISALTAGSTVDELWEHIKQSASAGDYLSASAPGSVIDSDFSASIETTGENSNFAVLNAQVIETDWLELSREGHRRAKFTTDTWEWLTP
jgi:pyridoxamine 5'-phosphate oxidase